MLYGMSAWCTHAVRDVPLDASDLVDVVLDQLGVVELHVPTHAPTQISDKGIFREASILQNVL